MSDFPYRALDFLYMVYQTPRPLRILVGPDVLSKYQRIFAFNLRLLRGGLPASSVKNLSPEIVSSSRERRANAPPPLAVAQKATI